MVLAAYLAFGLGLKIAIRQLDVETTDINKQTVDSFVWSQTC